MYQKAPTKEQMEAKGWEFGPPRECNRCGASIYWGRSPEGKNASFTSGTTTFHLKACGQASPAPRPVPPTAPPPAPSAPATTDLQVAMIALTESVRELTAELRSRRPAPPSAPAAPPRPRLDSDGCPM
jgi:hypothetical protein